MVKLSVSSTAPLLVVLLLPPGLVTLRVWSTELALKPVIVQPAGVVRMALPATKLEVGGERVVEGHRGGAFGDGHGHGVGHHFADDGGGLVRRSS
jgi:hypothetical protein